MGGGDQVEPQIVGLIQKVRVVVHVVGQSLHALDCGGGVRVGEPLGADPRIADLVVDRVRAAVDGSATSHARPGNVRTM